MTRARLDELRRLWRAMPAGEAKSLLGEALDELDEAFEEREAARDWMSYAPALITGRPE